ncbi:hypothetical protein [Sphingosinicella sp. LY1275]|uniref:hypothetical protein n=1 Tax=Sphingosinicella sp. LY1275 TaxID=3095379 RepID=UPI002ADEEAC9|nr:hypothetical protein [Sphingosinicella sp. LY1275]MEA1013199.1 hypothetical protein [Sphingosinicella sp. LY1275]
MWVGETTPLQFVVAPDEAGISEAAEDAETSEIRRIDISVRMRVTLLPHRNFEIVSKDRSPEQPLGRDERASWAWDVTPLKEGGDFTLFAEIEVLDAAGHPLDSYKKRVPVAVDVDWWRSFVALAERAETGSDLLRAVVRSWETTLLAIAALLAALAGVAVGVRKLVAAVRGAPASPAG